MSMHQISRKLDMQAASLQLTKIILYVGPKHTMYYTARAVKNNPTLYGGTATLAVIPKP